MTDWKDLRDLSIREQWQKVLGETHFARTMALRYATKLLGFREGDDHDGVVPDHVGVSRIAEPGGTFWYLLATYGTTEAHDHVEIKLSRERLEQLSAECGREFGALIREDAGDEKP